MDPLPSRKTLPTEVKAAVLAAPTSSDPIGAALPATAGDAAAAAGTKSEVLTPSQPNDPPRSPLPPQERACMLGTTAKMAPSIVMPERDNLIIDFLLNKFLTNSEHSKNYKICELQKCSLTGLHETSFSKPSRY